MWRLFGYIRNKTEIMSEIGDVKEAIKSNKNTPEKSQESSHKGGMSNTSKRFNGRTDDTLAELVYFKGNKMIILKKGDNQQLDENNYLTQKEIDCKCSACTFTMLDERTLASFLALRKEYGEPIQVNSGYRCMIHNAEVGGKPLSKHQMGMALDLTIKGCRLELLDLSFMAEQVFDKVIIYSEFIHCHNEPSYTKEER